MFKFLSLMLLFEQNSFLKKINLFNIEFLTTRRLLVYKNTNRYKMRIELNELENLDNLTVLNVFKKTGFFFTQVNLNCDKPIFYIPKKDYLKDEDLIYPTLISILNSIYNFKYFFILNKLNYINFKLFFLNKLNEQFTSNSM